MDSERGGRRRGWTEHRSGDEPALSLEAQVRFLFKFCYYARYDASGSEREICHVYAGPLTGRPAVNANEIAATTMMPAAALDHEVAVRPELYTPWLKLEWAQVRGEMWPTIQEFLGASRS